MLCYLDYSKKFRIIMKCATNISNNGNEIIYKDKGKVMSPNRSKKK